MAEDRFECSAQARRASQDRRATERWLNEGGHVAPEAVVEREMARDDACGGAIDRDRRAIGAGGRAPRRHSGPSSRSRAARRRVVIAGGGVAGLETLLGLRSLAGDRVEITLVEPELTFVNRSMAVREPFKGSGARGVRTEDIAAQFGAHWVRRRLDRVAHDERVAITKDGLRLPYDMLVVAVGARRPEPAWPPTGQLTFYDARDTPAYAGLLRHVRAGRINTLAFVRPAGPSWPMPMYDLALLTAADCASHGRSAEVALTLITPEPEPLGVFGRRASAGIRSLLDQAGVKLHTSTFAEPAGHGCLNVMPGHRRLQVDGVVTESRLVGPRLRGIRCDPDGFIPTDPHGRLPGIDGVLAAGDPTAFPIKQGGLAAQQADAVAEAIAYAAGADIRPQPFSPILRGTLLTGATTHYLRADISGTAGDDSTISTEALWWPPNKLWGRYLAPYLSQVDDGADVMPHDEVGSALW
jgi:sulfide:quinone oxidoreductase